MQSSLLQNKTRTVSGSPPQSIWQLARLHYKQDVAFPAPSTSRLPRCKTRENNEINLRGLSEDTAINLVNEITVNIKSWLYLKEDSAAELSVGAAIVTFDQSMHKISRYLFPRIDVMHTWSVTDHSVPVSLNFSGYVPREEAWEKLRRTIEK